MKDIITETVQQGIEGAKTSGKVIAVIGVILTGIAIEFGTLNYFFPGRWPTTEEEIDAYVNERGVIFDFRKPEGILRLGLSLLTITGIGNAFYIIRSLNQRRNQPAEVAKRIDYMPPEE